MTAEERKYLCMEIINEWLDLSGEPDIEEYWYDLRTESLSACDDDMLLNEARKLKLDLARLVN